MKAGHLDPLSRLAGEWVQKGGTSGAPPFGLETLGLVHETDHPADGDGP